MPAPSHSCLMRRYNSISQNSISPLAQGRWGRGIGSRHEWPGGTERSGCPVGPRHFPSVPAQGRMRRFSFNAAYGHSRYRFSRSGPYGEMATFWSAAGIFHQAAGQRFGKARPRACTRVASWLIALRLSAGPAKGGSNVEAIRWQPDVAGRRGKNRHDTAAR
jgi:hypothetical protein